MIGPNDATLTELPENDDCSSCGGLLDDRGVRQGVRSAPGAGSSEDGSKRTMSYPGVMTFGMAAICAVWTIALFCHC